MDTLKKVAGCFKEPSGLKAKNCAELEELSQLKYIISTVKKGGGGDKFVKALKMMRSTCLARVTEDLRVNGKLDWAKKTVPVSIDWVIDYLMAIAIFTTKETHKCLSRNIRPEDKEFSILTGDAADEFFRDVMPTDQSSLSLLVLLHWNPEDLHMIFKAELIFFCVGDHVLRYVKNSVKIYSLTSNEENALRSHVLGGHNLAVIRRLFQVRHEQIKQRLPL